jgi:hypothetical protein
MFKWQIRFVNLDYFSNQVNDLSVLRGSYIQNSPILSMEQLFVSCPSCEGNNLYLTKYDAPLKILKERSWLICKDCDYQIQTEEYKKTLFCV